MVALPQPPSHQKTLDAVRAEMQTRAAQEPPRDYLGASSLGHECDRYLWYLARGYKQGLSHPNAVSGSEDGYRCEPILIERLKLLPYLEVITHQPNGEQYGFSDLDGKLKGHPDGFIKGILEAPETWHILEFKSKKEEQFKKLVKLVNQDNKTALYHWDFGYYVQAQMYMRYFELKRHYLICCLPGARDMISCRTDYDAQFAEQYYLRAKRIIETENIPDRRWNKPDFFKCKFCPFREQCWNS